MNRNWILWIIVGVIVIGVGALLLSGRYSSNMNNMNNKQNQNNQQQNTSNTVNIINFSFQPGSLTVKAGDTVTWVNNDSTTHTITSDNGAFTSSGNLAPGDKYQFTFTKAGTYPYHCSIHPSMTATVTVQ